MHSGRSISSAVIAGLFVLLTITTRAPSACADQIPQSIACGQFTCTVDSFFERFKEGGGRAVDKFGITNTAGPDVIGGGVFPSVTLKDDDHDDSDKVTVEVMGATAGCTGALPKGGFCQFALRILPGAEDENPDGDTGLNTITTTFDFLIPGQPKETTIDLPAVRANVMDATTPEPSTLLLLTSGFAGILGLSMRRLVRHT
jgi:hypothetical protein